MEQKNKNRFTTALKIVTILLLVVLASAALNMFGVIDFNRRLANIIQPIILILTGVIAVLLPHATKKQSSIMTHASQGDNVVTFAGIALIGIGLITLIMNI